MGLRREFCKRTAYPMSGLCIYQIIILPNTHIHFKIKYQISQYSLFTDQPTFNLLAISSNRYQGIYVHIHLLINLLLR